MRVTAFDSCLLLLLVKQVGVPIVNFLSLLYKVNKCVKVACVYLYDGNDLSQVV